LPAQETPAGLSTQLDTGPHELVIALLKENERLRSAIDQGAGHEVDIRPISEIVTDLPGSFQKSKFFGQSHWMNAMEPVRFAPSMPCEIILLTTKQYGSLGERNTVVNPNTDRVEVSKSTELYKTINELKTMGRVLKSARILLPTISPETLDSLPSKNICDRLVDGYLRTFEGIFRVLHVPSFRKEYDSHWSESAETKPSVMLKTMLVCAIGVPFYTGVDQPQLRVACTKWIQAAEMWVAAPHAKSRLNMAGLQIQILILLAKQVCNVEGDHVWISAGSVLRTAMYLGLHRDPSYFGKINIFHAEMRRRLWATVLELTCQSSLDMGMPPMISDQDYDVKAPSNINDDDLHEQDEELPLTVGSSDLYTDCSVQIAFIESLPLRLQILRQLNSLRFDLPYSECLRLGKELTELCHTKTQFLKNALGTSANITPFQVKLVDSLVRRFVLGLHRPFFAKANEHPQYYFSRKTCLDESLAIIAPATSPVVGVADDWSLMTYRATGFFKALILYAISTVCYELNTQIEEQRATRRLTAPLVSDESSQEPFQLSSQSQLLYDALVSAYHITVARLRNGETNAKGVVYFACAIARVDALVQGADPEAMVLNAAKSNIAEMRRILADVYEQEHGQPIDLSASSLSARDHGRGDGADDVTGQSLPTGTGTGGLDGEFGSTGLDLGFGWNSDANMDFGIDSNSFSTVGLMDFNFQFMQNPEWFFDTGSWVGTANMDNLGADTF
jgi:hypothetical protein